MKKLLLLMIVLFAFVATGVAQYHPAPVYHPPPAYHPPAHTNTYHPPAHTNTYHAPRQNAQPRQNHTTTRNNTPRSNTSHNNHNAQRNNTQRNQRNANRNADRARSNAHKNANKAIHKRNNQRRHDYRAARSAYRNGRFNDRFYGAHFGAAHPIAFGGPGLWVGRPFFSPFWWGGVEFGFGPGIFWPDAWGMGFGVYIEYIPGVGYVLADPAFPDTTLPLTVDIDAQPVDDPDQQ